MAELEHPAFTYEAPSTHPLVSAEQARSGLGKVAAATPLPMKYRLWLFGTAGAMLLLPLAYVALVAGAGWLTVWYALASGEFMSLEGGTRGSLYVLVRFGPSFVAACVFLALLKPLVARPTKGRERRTLRRAEAPALFTLVERISEATGAPRPSQIDVDLEVNASAGYRRGWIGALKGELVLTLGLPLVRGFDARSLSAIIAHELGHFSQGGAMRASLVIRMVQSWFARVAFERDRFDTVLNAMREKNHHWITTSAAAAAQGAIWLSRKTLIGLLHVGEWIVSGLSREMEFDADRYAVRVAGSETLAFALPELSLLDAADTAAYRSLNESLEDGAVADDMVEMVALHRAGIPDKVCQEILRETLERTPHMYASHPPTRDRVARAHALDATTNVTLDSPAHALFNDMPAICRAETEALYKRSLGRNSRKPERVSAVELHERVCERNEALAAVSTAFGGVWTGTFVPAIPRDLDAPSSPDAAFTAADAEHEANCAEAVEALDAISDADHELRQRQVVGILVSAGMTNEDELETEVTPEVSAAADIYGRTEEMAEITRRRLAAARALLVGRPEADRLERALWSMANLSDALPEALAVWRMGDVVRRAGEVLDERIAEGEPKKSQAIPPRMQMLEEGERLLAELRKAIGASPLTQDKFAAACGLADHVLGDAPKPKDVVSMADALDGASGRFYTLYQNALAEAAVALIALRQPSETARAA